MNGLENILYFKFKLNQKAYLGSISRIRSDPLKPFHTRFFFVALIKKYGVIHAIQAVLKSLLMALDISS
jgi:hypothetical protein